MMKRQQVLVIDDDPMIHKLVAVRLKPLDVDVNVTSTGEQGIAQAREQPPDLILLDVNMPMMDGFEVCRLLRNNSITNEIPIIFLTGSEAAAEKVRAFDLGATDYLTKPFDAGELVARVRNALRTQALLEALEAQARTDSLTGLPNRSAFRRVLTQCVERAKCQASYRFAVLFIDLDRFKVINDSLGHAIGDELLINVAERIRGCVANRRSSSLSRSARDLVARMGGDEFTILLDNIKSDSEAEHLATSLRNSLDETYEMQGYHVRVGLSIGIRIADGELDSADTVLRDSDTAMYHAKSSGRGRHVVFDRKMHEQAVGRLEMESALARAVVNREFHVVYQPVIVTESGELAGMEALVRWRSGTGDALIPPDEFIPVAEETGIIVEIGNWMLDHVCQQLAAWRKQFPEYPDLWCSINISKIQCEQPGLLSAIVDALARHHLQSHVLKLEITESAIMHDMNRIIPMLEELRALGIQVAMDDFGTGYSSLASLRRFPIDILKIDRSFVQNIDRCRTYSAIVAAIATLAQNLNMAVVAEGIETTGQLAQIQTLDCDYVQGYLLCKPMPGEQFESWLRERRSEADKATSNVRFTSHSVGC
ncbi:putative bifunctional diguanylate cyclase/phosphodiesterase [Phycisphaerales bacterium AB-hyl4]|uniref:Bifunctional diguanylate cyclase/phosphodiesterase n=1 Tax=Natronomicrosphaera hydrolytica TaxID=3242702 RepID=A0ABV4U041_9BACT